MQNFKDKQDGTMSQLNANLAKIEKGFNVLGSCPLVAFGSGLVRSSLGAVQFKVGIVTAGVGLVGQVIHPQSKKMENITEMGGEQAIHGALNVVRGLGEALAGITIVGSLIPLTLQLYSKDGFAPRFQYNIEMSIDAHSY